MEGSARICDGDNVFTIAGTTVCKSDSSAAYKLVCDYSLNDQTVGQEGYDLAITRVETMTSVKDPNRNTGILEYSISVNYDKSETDKVTMGDTIKFKIFPNLPDGKTENFLYASVKSCSVKIETDGEEN